MIAKMALREIAFESRAAREVLRRHKIDFCCEGARDFEEVCGELGLEAGAVLAEVEKAKENENSPEGWQDRPLLELIDHIMRRYHEPAREELPRIVALAEEVERENAAHALCPNGLAAHLRAMAIAMNEHMDQEEEMLFPILRGDEPDAYPIAELWRDHEQNDDKLRETRRLTHDLEAPAGAGAQWRDLYARLDAMEADLMEHMYIENNVLFEWFPER